MLRRWYRGESKPLTPVSSMRSFWGLMKAYWFSDRWREAWGLTVVIAVLTALSAKAGVWFAESSGDLVNAIALYHDPKNTDPLTALLESAGMLVAIVLLKDAGFTGVRHYFSATLHRKWRAWLDGRFNMALLDANHTHFHVQHGAAFDADGQALGPPDNVDQRVQESIKGMTGGAIGLAMGVGGVIASLYFVGEKLVENSTDVSGLEIFGSYGSAVLALMVVATYVPLNTFVAIKLGSLLQRLTVRMQQAEGSYRGELTTFLRRSFHVAASRSEDVQQAMHGRLYGDIDLTWRRLNWINAGYMSFELVYNFVAARIVAYAPSLLPYIQNKISLKYYVTGAELVASLISQCSWFIHVMPDIATLKANARRVTELAVAIENVQRPQDFYNRSGRSDFRYGGQDAIFGLTIQKLELMHQGESLPFLTATSLRFRRGEWTFVKGESGSGKTSLIKAIHGLWPYGGGNIIFPEGVKSFYAAQDVKLPRVTLKQLVCLPSRADEYTDARVAAMLHKAGLGDFIEYLGDEARDGMIWDQLLSGGQKQKLVLARILLQRPGLLFLDEATGALDPEATVALHEAIKEHCPGITVISIMHDAVPPKSASGGEFYDSVLSIADGVATKRPLAVLPFEQRRAARKSVANSIARA
jgi:ABC-type uncharacterized transport system fused permease/ATPase subunit